MGFGGTAGGFEQAGLQAIIRGLGQYTRDAGRIQAANKGIFNSLTSVQKISSGFGTALVTAAVAGGAASVVLASNFEEQMSKIAGLTDTPKAAIDDLRKGILDLAGEVGVSPQELGAGAYFILSSGIKDTATAMEILEVSAKAAVAGLGETQTIAKTTTAVMNAYGLSVNEVDSVINTLVGTVRKGAAEPAALAGSLGFIIPLAAQMGVEFEQVGAVLATLTNIGLDAENAVTALKGVLSQLLQPTKETTELFNALNEATGNQLGTIDQFRQKIDEDFVGAMTTLFNVIGDNDEIIAKLFPDIRGLIGALGGFGAQGEETAQILHDLQTETGFLDQAFEEATNTTNFKFRQAVAELQVELIELGEHALPAVTAVLESFIFVLGAIDEHLGTVVEIIRGFVEALKNLDPVALAAFIPILIALNGAIVTLAISVGTLALAFAPLTLALLATGGFVFAIGVARTDTEKLPPALRLLKAELFELAAAFFDASASTLDWATTLGSLGLSRVIPGARDNVKSLRQEAENFERKAHDVRAEVSGLDFAFRQDIKTLADYAHQFQITAEQAVVLATFIRDLKETMANPVPVGPNPSEADALRLIANKVQKIKDSVAAPVEGPNIDTGGAQVDLDNLLDTVEEIKEVNPFEEFVKQEQIQDIIRQAAETGQIAWSDVARLWELGAHEAANDFAAFLRGEVSQIGDDIGDSFRAIAEKWMTDVERGILDGTVDVLDALAFLESGMVNAAESIVEGLAQQASDIGEQWQILVEILKRGTVEISDVNRLFDLNATEAALDLLRFLAGEESNIGEAIIRSRRAGRGSAFRGGGGGSGPSFATGGFIPPGQTVGGATLHGGSQGEIIVPLGSSQMMMTLMSRLLASVGGGVGGSFRNYGTISVGGPQGAPVERALLRALGA